MRTAFKCCLALFLLLVMCILLYTINRPGSGLGVQDQEVLSAVMAGGLSALDCADDTTDNSMVLNPVTPLLSIDAADKPFGANISMYCCTYGHTRGRSPVVSADRTTQQRLAINAAEAFSTQYSHTIAGNNASGTQGSMTRLCS